MQHIEDAGIHSGDSACVLPPYLIGERDMQTMREQTIAMAKAFNVVGLINVQFAIKDGVVYVLEVNPRASRTIPFVSKAIGVPLASHAARVMCGETLEEIGFTEEIMPPFVSVKEAVFPFNKFPGTDPVLGPEMRSTGEVMGISDSFGTAFAKAQLAASNGLPLEGAILDHGERLGQADGDADRASLPRDGLQAARHARHGAVSARARHPGERVFKVHEGRPNCLDMIVNGDVAAAGQHAARQARAVGRLHAAPGGDPPPHRVHDDAVGGERRVRRDPVAQVAAPRRCGRCRSGSRTSSTPRQCEV